MTNTPQNLTPNQLDARIIEARQWLNSDSPCFWDQEWNPEDTAALQTTTETTPQTTTEAAEIIKLTRAIEAIADLPTLRILEEDALEVGEKFLRKLKAERDQLRRAIAIGEGHVRRCEAKAAREAERRSCGECGNPMRPTGRNASSIQTTPMGLFLCETTVCSEYGAPVLVRLDN